MKFVKQYAVPGSGSHYLELLMREHLDIHIFNDLSFLGWVHGKPLNGTINWNPHDWVNPKRRMGVQKSDYSIGFAKMCQPFIDELRNDVDQAFADDKILFLFGSRSPYSWIQTGHSSIIAPTMGQTTNIKNKILAYNELHLRFIDFIMKNPTITHTYTHEDLIVDPSWVIRTISNRFGVPMLSDKVSEVKQRILLTSPAKRGQHEFDRSRYEPNYYTHIDRSHVPIVNKHVDEEVMEFFEHKWLEDNDVED